MQARILLAWVAVLTLDHVATSGVGPMVRVLTNEFTWLPIKLALMAFLTAFFSAVYYMYIYIYI